MLDIHEGNLALLDLGDMAGTLVVKYETGLLLVKTCISVVEPPKKGMVESEMLAQNTAGAEAQELKKTAAGRVVNQKQIQEGC